MLTRFLQEVSMTVITFEQPVTELTRVCLRLEFLFKTLNQRLEAFAHTDPQYTMQLLIEIIMVLDRPDFKSKLVQELHRYLAITKKFHNAPGLEADVTHQHLDELQRAVDFVSSISGKLGQHLEAQEFLNTIRSNLHIPGNGSCIDTPNYYYWLSNTKDNQLKQFQRWQSELQPINKIVLLVLNIIRDSCEKKSCIAENGYYHQNLETSPCCQLIRIQLDYDQGLYPEISAGKHRFTVRFMKGTIENPTQAQDNVKFDLCTCSI